MARPRPAKSVQPDQIKSLMMPRIIYDPPRLAATEAAIRESFHSNLKDTTVIIIAQRISSVQYADEILILDDDHIAGRGTHEELMKTNKIYQEIYQSQQEGVGG